MNRRSGLRRWGIAASLTIVVALVGCSAITAQNPSGNWKPVNAVPADSEPRLLLKGADVVAYFTDNKHVQGDPAFRSTYEGVNLRFASADHKAAFDREPARYLPQFGGYCANGIVYGIPWGGDADNWKMIDGKLYVFGGVTSREGFELDLPRNMQLAERYWNDEVKGNNSFLQRTKRLVFRVPHYMSGEDLAKAVQLSKLRKQPG